MLKKLKKLFSSVAVLLLLTTNTFALGVGGGDGGGVSGDEWRQLTNTILTPTASTITTLCNTAGTACGTFASLATMLGILTADNSNQIYIDGGRTDTYTPNGSILLPYKSITAAITDVESDFAAAVDKQTTTYSLNVAPGTYADNLTITTLKHLKISGVGVVISGDITIDQSPIGGSGQEPYTRIEFVGMDGFRPEKGSGLTISGDITATRTDDSLAYLNFKGAWISGNQLFDTDGTWVVQYENSKIEGTIDTGTFSDPDSAVLIETTGRSKFYGTITDKVSLYNVDNADFYGAITTTPIFDNYITNSRFHAATSIVAVKTLSVDSATYKSLLTVATTLTGMTTTMIDGTFTDVIVESLTDGTASLTGGSLTGVKLGTLTGNGFVKTSGSDGTLSVDTSTYLTAEADPIVGAITGITKADGAGNISAAVANTDYSTPRAQTVTVAKSGGDFDTIQGAIDSITDATTSKRYIVLIYPGEYAENVVMEEYVSLSGVGDHVATTITATSGTTLTMPPGTSATNLRNISIENTGDGGIVLSQAAGFCILYDVYLSWINSENGESGLLVDLDGGTFSMFGGKLRYNGGGDSVGAVAHQPVQITGSTSAKFKGVQGDLDIEDVDDNLFVFNLDASFTGKFGLENGSYEVDALDAAYSGDARFISALGLPSEQITIENNHLDLTSAGNGTAAAVYLDSPAGGLGLIISASIGSITGFATNNAVNTAAGDSVTYASSSITAADGDTGAGSFYYFGNALNGDYYVSEDVHASYIEFDDAENTYVGLDKTYPTYFAFSNDETNFWLGNASDPNIWMNYEKDADIILGQGTGGDTDIVISEGSTNKTTLNQSGIDFKITNETNGGDIILEPEVSAGVADVSIGDNSDANYRLTFNADTNDGLIEWDEDNDVFLTDNISATTFTGALTGTASGNLVSGGALGTPSSGTLTNCTFPTLNQNTSGTAANLSGTPALPDGTTATTQSDDDNSTKLATTAYVDAAAGGGGGAFELDTGVIMESGISGTSSNDFVLNADAVYNTTQDARVSFDSSKYAFRAGQYRNTDWNLANVGDFSVAFGTATIASGSASFAAGNGPEATGTASSAFGGATKASTLYSQIVGNNGQTDDDTLFAVADGSFGDQTTQGAGLIFEVESGGSVGIGTIDPVGMLHADGDTGFGQITLDGASGGCLMFRDTDDAGWTECSALDGTLTCTTDADGICDGA